MSFNKLRIGHITDSESATGVTVFLLPEGSQCGWFLAGSAPATREVSLLEPWATVHHIDALVFAGGSAYGLGVTDGVIKWLREKGRGVKTDHGVVPIAPTACIYDLGIGLAAPPTPMDGYQACEIAKPNNLQQGNVGAATGASIGKLFLQANPMTGGFGLAEISIANIVVRAYAVVNCVGDVMDNGKIIAGAVQANNQFFDITQSLLAGNKSHSEIQGACENTTLVAVFTNVFYDKAQLTRLAKAASSGIAKAISPSFTMFDGDAIFCCAIGKEQGDEFLVSTMMAEATRRAIINAVSNSKEVK